MAGQIVRVWRGYGKEAGVDRYCREHFPNSVLPQLHSIDGFVEAKVLTRPGRGETEVVVEPVVRELLNRFDERVAHVTVALAASKGRNVKAT
jgi:hypothetical protein